MRKYSKKFKQEVEKQIPDAKLKIKLSVDWNLIKVNNELVKLSAYKQGEQGTESSEKATQSKKTYRFRLSKPKLALTSICLMVLLTLGVSLPLVGIGNASGELSVVDTDTYDIIIDVNPSIQLSVNESGIVTEQSGLNKDGVILLYNEDFTGKSVETATKEVISKIDNAGFFKQNAEISFCLSCDKGKRIKGVKDKEEQLENYINQFLEEANIDIELSHISSKSLSAIKKAYKVENIKEYAKNFDKKFKEELINQLDSIAFNLDGYMESLFAYIFNGDNPIQRPTLDAFNNFCDKYHYPIEIKYDYTITDIQRIYGNLVKYKTTVAETIEKINSNSGNISNQLGDFEELFESSKQRLYAVEN